MAHYCSPARPGLPYEPAEVWVGVHRSVRWWRDREPLEGLTGRSERFTFQFQGVVRRHRPKIVSLRTRVRECTSINEKLIAPQSERECQCVRMTVAAAQGAMRPSIDDGDRIIGTPTVTKHRDTSAREVHITPDGIGTNARKHAIGFPYTT